MVLCPRPPGELVLEDHDVQVWRIEAPEGRARGRAVVALRSILAHTMGVEPTSVRVAVDERGKPYLDGGFGIEVGGFAGLGGLGGDDIRFSVSHAPGVTLVAVTRGRAVGVDVEVVRSDFDDAGLVARLFSRRERAQLEELPEPQRRAAFFACWVRKEAYLKATGEGLAGGLAHFDVSVGPDEPARLLAVHGHPDEAAWWALQALDLGPTYAAALAVQAAVHPTPPKWRPRCARGDHAGRQNGGEWVRLRSGSPGGRGRR